MKGLWLENGSLSYQKALDRPAPKQGEALVRVMLAGICNTDLELIKGYYPFKGVIGHEFVGRIVACPDEPSRIQQRVVGEINVNCGKCPDCSSGRGNHCPNRTVLGISGRDGAFAEYLSLPTKNLLEVPDSIPDEQAVFVEPLAAALQILEQVPIVPSQRVLLIGGGKLGQLIAGVLNGTGCEFVVLAKYEQQASRLRELGISVAEKELWDHPKFDVVVEATGNPEGFSSACSLVRPRGSIILKSTYHGNTSVDFSQLVVDEITVIGSRCGPFGPALRILADGKIDPLALVTDRFPLSRGLEAISAAAEPSALKVLLQC